MQRKRSGGASVRSRLVLGMSIATVGALSVVMGAGATTPAPAHEADAIDPVNLMVNARLGVLRSDLVHVDVDTSRRNVPIETVIEVQGRRYTLDLQPHSSRSEDYRVFHADADGNLTEVEPRPVNTMRGVVVGDPDSLVAASVMDDGLAGRIIFSDGEEFWFEPVAWHLPGLDARLHAVYHRDDVLPTGGTCIALEAAGDPRGGQLTEPVGEPASGGDLYICELAIDADFFYQNRWGNGTEDRVNSVIDQMDVQYNRDVDIDHLITTIIIRTSQVYTSNNAETLLNQFRSRWLANHQNVARDIAQLFTGRSINGGVIGIAWLSQICASRTSGFGFSLVESDFNNIFACATDLSAHELGHNWSAGHCNCNGWTMNPFITCANRFIQSSRNSIINHRNSRNCLDIGDPQEPPVNDDCANAESISEGSFDFDTSFATTDGPDLPPQCEEGFGLSLVQDIWFDYTATCTGTATIDLCTSNYDTRMAVYTGEGGCPGAIIDCNDDACGANGLRSQLVIDVVSGEDYTIRVGGFDTGGTGTLDVSCEPDKQGAPADPESFEVTRGQYASGDLDDLLSSNNQYVRINALKPFVISESSVEIEVTGTAVTDSPSQISLTVEAASEGFPVRRITQMFNYDTNSFETVDQRPGSTSDTTVTIVIDTNAARFVEPGTREVKARIGYLDLGVTFVAWQGRFDEIFWFVEP